MIEILAYSGGPSGPGRRPRRKPHRVRLYVVHLNIGPETPKLSAENVARYCARPLPPDYPAYHVIHDDDSDVLTAHDDERVNGAGGVAEVAYHACIVGRADQTAAQWADNFSTKAIAHAAAWARIKCPELGIPLRKINAAQVAADESGICGHWDVTQAYPANNAGHYDPGPHFPWDHFMELVRAETRAPEPVRAQEDDGVTLIWYGGYPHLFWIDNKGALQHDFGGVENMGARYGVHETFDPARGVTALVAPDGALHVRTITTDGRAIRWGFNGKGWGASAAVPV